MKSDKEMIAVKQELDAATAATLETKGYFIQKHVHTVTDRELASVKQDLAVVKTDLIRTRNEALQKLTRAERDMANLTKVATAQRDAMDKLVKQVKENPEKLDEYVYIANKASDESDSDDGYYRTNKVNHGSRRH